MRFETMNRDTAKALRVILSAVLEEALDGTGVTAEVGSIRFNDTSATIKIEAALVDGDGSVRTKAAEDFRRLALGFGITRELGDRFTSGGEEYEISGLNTRAPKYPVQAKRVRDGRRFKFPVRVVREMWASEALDRQRGW